MKRYLTKLLLFTLIVMLAIPTAAFTETGTPSKASDVNESDYNDHWANTIIQKWINAGRISGYEKGVFKPDQPVTRAEFITIVNKGMGYTEKAEITFSDVQPEHWFYEQVRIAVKAGYITGYSETLYGPNDLLTREQAAVIIARIEGLEDDISALNKFSDKNQIADWAKGKVGAVVKAGYMTGYPDGTFGPKKALSRAETVATLDRTPSRKLEIKPPEEPPEETSNRGSGGSGGGGGSSYTTADMVLKNGKIYTIDDDNTVAEAIAVKDGKIIKVGTVSHINKHIGKETRVINLNGKTVLPGFLDTHLHPPGTALSELFSIDLYSVLTKEAALAKIKAYIEEHPHQEAYFGSGFDMGIAEDPRGPDKEWLDEICNSKPIVLGSSDGHNLWMNEEAFRVSGIQIDTDPKFGTIHLKNNNTEFLGTLTDCSFWPEDNIKIPRQTFTEEQRKVATEYFLQKMTKWGYTGFQNAGSSDLDRLLALEDAEKLHSRVNWSVTVRTNSAFKVEEVRTNGAIDVKTVGAIEFMSGEKERVESQSDLITLKTAKFFADGVVEGATAYLLEPYTEAAQKGSDYYGDYYGGDSNELAEFFTEILEEGFNIHVHSVGDASTRKILNAFETAQESAGEGDYRNTITHLQVVHDDDIKRFGELDVIASCQVYWHLKDPSWWFGIESPLLGKERAENEYPLGSFLDAGAVIAASSDYPVTPDNNPFVAIEIGITRNLPGAYFYDEDGLLVDDIVDINDPTYLLDDDERITVLDMVKAYTIDNAYTMFMEDSVGSLEKGKFADMIVIDQDIFEINSLDIDKTKVLATIFNGEVVYQQTTPSLDAAAEAFLKVADVDYSYETATELIKFESRYSGSEAEYAAAEMLAQRMKDIGLKDVKLDAFSAVKWEFKGADMQVTSSQSDGRIMPMSTFAVEGTPPEGIEGELIYLEKGTMFDYEGIDVEDKIVLIDINMNRDWWICYPALQAEYKKAAALVCVSEGNYPSDDTLVSQDFCGPVILPTLNISQKDAGYLKDLLKEGSVTVNIKSDNTVDPNGTSHNVVGKIPGKTEECIIIGAHYDAHFEGFQDNASGTSTVISIAKGMIDSGYTPERTMIFILFGAEEYAAIDSKFDWAIGSWTAVNKLHPEWVGEAVAFINLDCLSGGISDTEGFTTTPEYADFLVEESFSKLDVDSELFATPNEIRASYPLGTSFDHFSFQIGGIPALSNGYGGGELPPDVPSYRGRYHTNYDNADTYYAPGWEHKLNVFGLLAMKFDRTPVVPLNFGTNMDEMMDSIDETGFALADVDPSELKSEITAFKALGINTYEEITHLNELYTLITESESAKNFQEELDAIYISAQEANDDLLAAYKTVHGNLTKLDWSDSPIFGHQRPQTNLIVLDESIDNLKAGNGQYALDELFYQVDDEWYSYHFDKQVNDHFANQVLGEYNKDNLYWGTGMTSGHVDLYDVIQSVMSKTEAGETDFSNEIELLKEKIPGEKEIFKEMVAEEIHAIQKASEQLSKVDLTETIEQAENILSSIE